MRGTRKPSDDLLSARTAPKDNGRLPRLIYDVPVHQRRRIVFHNSKIALAAVFVLGALSASLAQGPRLPKLDLQRLCAQNDAAVRAAVSDVSQDFVSNCVADEQGARDEIEKAWSTFSPLDKSRCVRPNEFLPGYVEWMTCLQMARDVTKTRKENASAPTASSAGETRRRCPLVKFAADGTIISVVACKF
jgi:hypothetical protein